jgi:hypothetical protein
MNNSAVVHSKIVDASTAAYEYMRTLEIRVQTADAERDIAINEARAEKEDLEAEIFRIRKVLKDLVEQVEMGESVGICLPDRAPALNAVKEFA